MHNESRAEYSGPIPIEAAIKTEELLHLTGAMHKAIADLDRLIDLQIYSRELAQIRTELNSALVQTYGF
jgi:hypothetical protein